MATTTDVLQALVEARIDDRARAWLADVREKFRAAQPKDALLEAYTSAPRMLGRGPLALDAGEALQLRAFDADWSFTQWSVADAGRALLLLWIAADGTSQSSESIAAAYENGDSAEQRSWLRVLPLLPHDARLLPLAIDACRVNVLSQFEAIACDNAYPARHFPELHFNQMVMKALFNTVPLARIVGLDSRANGELARMADDYVSEREAASRSVPADIWRVIAPFATGARLERLRRYEPNEVTPR